MDFFNPSSVHLWLAVALSLFNGGLLCFVGYKFLQVLQLSGYKINGFRIWLSDTHGKYILRLALLTFLSSVCMLVTNVLFDNYIQNNYYVYFGLLFYLTYSVVFIRSVYNVPNKTPLKHTWRMNRLIAVHVFIVACVTFGIIALASVYIPFVGFAAIGLTPVLIPFTVILSHFITYPFEMLNRARYLVWAKRKLNKMPNLIKIGITGSYGKTSVKHMLNTILAEKYSVCMSPHSFNTPMGITKVVLYYLKEEHEVLICEMGAKQGGDIRELCHIVHPQMGILTAIGTQHLNTFWNVENIKKTKNELVLSLPADGFCVFNGENAGSAELFEKCKIAKEMTKINAENAKITARKCKFDQSGMTFDLAIGKDTVSCTTSLLGKHNLENILMCVAMADKLGLSIKQISEGISKLKPIPHRLELIKQNDVIILDDAYNSSVEGSRAALEVLNMFSGGKKMVVTPGLVELGSKEKEENTCFGEAISEVCDYVIIVNEQNKASLLKGLKNKEFPDEKVFFAQNLTEAQNKLEEVVESGDIILFENDLPDNYV